MVLKSFTLELVKTAETLSPVGFDSGVSSLDLLLWNQFIFNPISEQLVDQITSKPFYVLVAFLLKSFHKVKILAKKHLRSLENLQNFLSSDSCLVSFDTFPAGFLQLTSLFSSSFTFFLPSRCHVDFPADHHLLSSASPTSVIHFTLPFLSNWSNFPPWLWWMCPAPPPCPSTLVGLIKENIPWLPIFSRAWQPIILPSTWLESYYA